MTDTEKLLEAFAQAIARIDKKLDALIEKHEKGAFIPGRDPNMPPTMPTWNINPHFGVSKCMKCGMEFKGSHGYVCSTYECPMGFSGSR